MHWHAQGLPLGKHYTNNHAATDFLHSFASVLKDDLAVNARTSPTISLTIDESTDAASIGQLIIYLRLRIDHRYQTKFWKIVEVRCKCLAS